MWYLALLAYSGSAAAVSTSSKAHRCTLICLTYLKPKKRSLSSLGYPSRPCSTDEGTCGQIKARTSSQCLLAGFCYRPKLRLVFSFGGILFIYASPPFFFFFGQRSTNIFSLLSSSPLKESTWGPAVLVVSGKRSRKTSPQVCLSFWYWSGRGLLSFYPRDSLAGTLFYIMRYNLLHRPGFLH